MEISQKSFGTFGRLGPVHASAQRDLVRQRLGRRLHNAAPQIGRELFPDGKVIGALHLAEFAQTAPHDAYGPCRPSAQNGLPAYLSRNKKPSPRMN